MPPRSRRKIAVIGIWWPPCWRTSPGSRARAERTVACHWRSQSGLQAAYSHPAPRFDRAPNLKADTMQDLSPRHVKVEESRRLGIVSGWYSTKVSGTFV